jgi:hypothetical protein
MTWLHLWLLSTALLHAHASTYELTVVTGLYSVDWHAMLPALPAIIATAPLSHVLEHAFESNYLQQHMLTPLSALSGLKTATNSAASAIVAAILPAERTLLPLHKATYTWPRISGLQQVLKQHGKQLLALHVFDPNSLADLQNKTNPLSIRHLHAFFTMQLALLLESEHAQCCSWMEGNFRQDTSAIVTMLDQLAVPANVNSTLLDVSHTGLRHLLIAIQSACKQAPVVAQRPDFRWDLVQPVLKQAGVAVGDRVAQLVRSTTAIIAQSSAMTSPTPARRVVFFAGLEGTGHHLWAHMLLNCSICKYDVALSKTLRNVMLMRASQSVAASALGKTRRQLRELFDRTQDGNQLTFINSARHYSGTHRHLCTSVQFSMNLAHNICC